MRTTPTLYTPRPTLTTTPTLSITYDTLPPAEHYRVYPMQCHGRDHILITVSDRLACAEIDLAYRKGLHPRIFGLVVHAFDAGDPDQPDHWTRWWDDDAVCDWQLIKALEETGRLARWPHGQ